MDGNSAFSSSEGSYPLQESLTGPLNGLDFVVKEMLDISGERTSLGNPDWLASRKPAEEHAHAVTALLHAGARLSGRTVCDEFLYSLVGSNEHYGAPVNPRVVEGFTGGSSSGSASAVSAGACDFALGSDTGGSVRIPAALCGIFGVRPTHGRVSDLGTLALAPSFDCVGWFSSSAGVLTKVGEVLLGERADERPVERILLVDELVSLVDQDVKAGFDQFAASSISSLSGEVEHVELGIDLAGAAATFQTIQGFEFWSEHGEWIQRAVPRIGKDVAGRVEAASQATEEQVLAAQEHQRTIRSLIEEVLQPGTALCLPTAPSLVLPRDASREVRAVFRARTLRMTCLAGLCGLPQVNMPVYGRSRVPFGVSFVGWRRSDYEILDLVRKAAPLACP